MLFKKLIRTMGQYKAQFISMIIMIAIGIGIFVGFNMEWTSIQKNTGKFFDETKLADYHVVTENVAGFTKEECDKIKNIDGVSAATRYATANVEVYEVNENYNSDIGSDKFVRNGDELALCVSEELTSPHLFCLTERSMTLRTSGACGYPTLMQKGTVLL